MAWRCSGASNSELVNNLIRSGIITSKRVEEAMRAVDRGFFTSNGPYADNPVPIGFNATISAPHMHAYALEALEPFLRPGKHALDIGSGSGYLTACMAHMVGENGAVVGVDHIPGLVDMARSNLKRYSPDLQSKGHVSLLCGDGRHDIFTTDAVPKFDAIHVGAAAPTLPQTLVDQLASPGRMIIPVGAERGEQYLLQLDKDSTGRITQRELMGVMYVPLTEASRQVR
ncbi:L-isoaspartyl protein carboxyl methyltransferase [Entophlyctis helioformis]|nr:L-isoaspartyl protein carboxyl methyltransferase [Entophlyctis helioformis]